MRALDFTFSFLAIVILFPIFVPVAILLKFTGEGEVFFLQDRIGKDGSSFKLFKFATMLKSSPSIGSGTITKENDPRILPVGRYLRNSKINELPQLLNVFLGQMSLVGPRPLTANNFEYYGSEQQKIIFSVRPGLSGIGSIVLRNEEKLIRSKDPVEFYKNVVAPYKGELEIWFVKKRSLFLYVSIIWLTIWVVIFPNSKLIWKIFKDIPKPTNDVLKSELL